jgi:hypothetical protein
MNRPHLEKKQSCLAPLLWLSAAIICGGSIFTFGYLYDLMLTMTLLASIVFAVLAYQASPKYLGPMLWLSYIGFIGGWLFAIGFLSDSGFFMTLLASLFFAVGTYQSSKNFLHNLDKGPAFSRGMAAGVLWLALGHALAYGEFRDRTCDWLNRSHPAYLGLDWPNINCDTAVDALLGYASGKRTPNNFWIYLRLRAAGGLEASTFSTPRARKTLHITFSDLWAWLAIMIQAGIVVVATGYAMFMVALNKDDSLEPESADNSDVTEKFFEQEGTSQHAVMSSSAVNAVSDPKTPADSGVNVPLENPPEQEQISLPDTWGKVWQALDNRKPAYVVVIQRFRAGGGYTLVEFASDRESADRALSNCGQRHPGFVIQCLQTNLPRHVCAKAGIKPLDQYVLHIGSSILLTHDPVASYENAVGRNITIEDMRRVEVIWTGNPKQNARKGRELLETWRYPALLGLVETICDSENGSYDRYYQDGLDTIGRGESG